jgi:NAD(P)-dependent dehydrogenase (short-subunit alcohol dehydrogenase family)
MPKLVHSVAIRQDYHGAIPLSRYGTPEESAAAAVFVCGDDASDIDGQALADDGGLSALGAGLPTLRKQLVLRGNRNRR